MEKYCISCEKNNANKSSSVKSAKQNKLMPLSNCAVCSEKKSRFIKQWILSDCNWTQTHNHLVRKLKMLNGSVFVYELTGCGFESSCSHLNFKFRACFEQGVPWHAGSYRVWIHSETRTWYDKNIQLINFKMNKSLTIFHWLEMILCPNRF